MTKPMEYNGYVAKIEYSDEDGCFIGHIVGIDDIVAFEGATVDEIREDFHNAVNSYLASCAKHGKQPHKAYSGKILLRTSPQLHAHIAARAEAAGKSINQYAVEVLANA
ncbi:MAG: type II toxin-antitoxin system HicB family antitoxin [Desulfovibrio sp.]|nr:type II toxin-antitoxin system HicB family antitoxin [Desulfovibrio sp.]